MKQREIVTDARGAWHKRVGRESEVGTTPVATERVRKLLEIQRVAWLPFAYKEPRSKRGKEKKRDPSRERQIQKRRGWRRGASRWKYS
jgi:hypothetical protein